MKADYHINKHGNTKKAWAYIESSLDYVADFPDSLALSIIIRLRRDAYKQQSNLFIDLKYGTTICVMFRDNVTEYIKKTTKVMMKSNAKIVPEEVDNGENV